jgi:[histone H4]-N-methyl-L-lysine20 N-methyltransferase
MARLTGIKIITIRDIEISKEIIVTYNNDYFRDNNFECLCKTCEDYYRND